MGKLDGKVALVSGGARGMGAAEVRRLHADGASVVAADVLDDDGKALADELGDRVRFVHLDVTSEEEWQSVVEQTERELGKVDVLVNNAAPERGTAAVTTHTAVLQKLTATANTPLDGVGQVSDLTLIGVSRGMKAATPAKRGAGGASTPNTPTTEGIESAPV